jgi:hypothetical protein
VTPLASLTPRHIVVPLGNEVTGSYDAIVNGPEGMLSSRIEATTAFVSMTCPTFVLSIVNVPDT